MPRAMRTSRGEADITSSCRYGIVGRSTSDDAEAYLALDRPHDNRAGRRQAPLADYLVGQIDALWLAASDVLAAAQAAMSNDLVTQATFCARSSRDRTSISDAWSDAPRRGTSSSPARSPGSKASY